MPTTLPGETGTTLPLPPLPGTEPSPPCTVPEFWADPKRPLAIVFLIASDGTLESQRAAAALWKEYNRLRA